MSEHPETDAEIIPRVPGLLEIPEWVTSAVVRVGPGRGFVAAVTDPDEPMVITCAHVLADDHIPAAHPIDDVDRLYGRYVGPLDAELEIMAECVFLDPIADVAVLVPPDTQELGDEHDAFVEFCQGRVSLPIAMDQRANFFFAGPDRDVGALLGLDGVWRPYAMNVMERVIHFGEERGITAGGMSGSPIVAHRRGSSAVGLVASSELNPRLAMTLPPWVLRRLSLR